MKKCSKCDTEKELILFYKDKSSKDGRRSGCIECSNKYRKENKERDSENKKEYYIKNKEKIDKRNKEYNIKNKSKINETSLNYVRDNKEKVSEYSKEYYLKNKEEIKNRLKKYYENNKERYIINDYSLINERHKQRKNESTLYRLTCNIRGVVSKSFIRNGYKKYSRTSDIIGCSFEEFKIYLESKFEEWMDWNNKGRYNGDFNYGWDIDHIIPISFAKTEEELIKLNHYTNLQPLCSKINRDIKKDKIYYEMD